MAQEKKYDIFISYSRKDFDEVNIFVKMLMHRIPTLEIWFDMTGIESGDEFRDKIISAIKRSQYVLFALSINSDQSKWTRKELQFANGKGKKIVPILLKGAKLEDMDWFLFEFGGVSYVDITDSKQIEQLIKNIASWTGKAIHSNQSKGDAAEPVSLGNVQELVALGAKLGSDGVPKELQEQFVNDLVKTKRLATAQNNLGFHWADPIKRIKYLEEAAKNGSSVAFINLAYIYEYGKGVDRDIDKAIDYYRAAIVNGHDEYIDDIKKLINEKKNGIR